MHESNVNLLAYQSSTNEQNRTALLARAAGIEPANAGVKVPCLAAWLRPNNNCAKGLAPLGAETELTAHIASVGF